MLKSVLRIVPQSLQIQFRSLQAGARRRRKQQSFQTDELETRLLMTVRVWDGGGGANRDWTNRFNWAGDVAPVANDDLSFPATAANRLTKNTFPANASGTFRSISFAGAGYSVTGNPIRLTSGISSTGPNQEIDASIQFVGSASRNVNVGTNAELTLLRSVSGTSPLVKQDFGRLILAGNNTFSGQFTVHDGIVQLAHSNALGSASAKTTVDDGAAIELSEFIGFGEEFPRTLQIAEPLFLAGGGIASTGALRNVSGDNRWTGPITLGDGSFAVGVGHEIIAVDAPGGEFTPDELTITGTISSNFSAGVRKRGTGRLTLSGTNTYFGETLIQEGVVQIKNSSALGSPTDPTRVDTGAALELAEIQLGGDETLPLIVTEPLQLSGNGLGNAGALRNVEGSNTWQGNITLTTSSRVGVDRDFDVLAITGLISGAGSGLTKIGSGELLLTRNNTYSGRTTVAAGALTVNGLQPASPVGVNNGGVLQGIGTVGTVNVSGGGAISPAASGIGTLTINGNFVNRGEFRVSVGQTTNDRLKVKGTVDLTNAPIKVSGNTTTKGLTVIENNLTDAVQGTTNGAQLTSTSGQVFIVNYSGGTGNDVVLARQNVAPMFTNRSVTPEINEGDDVIVGGTIVDADALDVFFMSVDWGDGQITQREFAPGTPREVNLAHKYVEQDNYTIHLTWTDPSRHGNSGVLQTVVRNVAPTLEAGATASLAMNTLFRRQLRFADPGLDAFIATVDYGDGSVAETLALGQSRNLSLSHRFTRRGSFRVTITVSDNDGGIGTDSFFVIVT